jgi:hypothetical protein
MFLSVFTSFRVWRFGAWFEVNMNIRLVGIPEQIIASAMKLGIAKTKTDAIMLGLLALGDKYSLLERLEDEEDVREAKRILADVKSGKEKYIGAKEFEKRTGLKIMR